MIQLLTILVIHIVYFFVPTYLQTINKKWDYFITF